jgi:hypothetical protein
LAKTLASLFEIGQKPHAKIAQGTVLQGLNVLLVKLPETVVSEVHAGGLPCAILVKHTTTAGGCERLRVVLEIGHQLVPVHHGIAVEAG